EPVALEPGDRLRHRGAGVPEALGDPRAHGRDPLLLQLVDRLEVHLRGVDQVSHVACSLVLGRLQPGYGVGRPPGSPGRTTAVPPRRTTASRAPAGGRRGP